MPRKLPIAAPTALSARRRRRAAAEGRLEVEREGRADGLLLRGELLDDAIDAVNHERSKIGAVQNRLSFTISNLSNHTQAIEAGRSAIADVDFAAEATALARNQILVQSGTAMLAQASAVSQNVLGLLI